MINSLNNNYYIISVFVLLIENALFDKHITLYYEALF